MTYIRVQARYTGRTGKPVGIFTACHHLNRKGRLTEEEARLFKSIDRWFDLFLPNPPFYQSGNKIRGITWFKSSATGMLRELVPLFLLLTKYDVAFDVVETDDPGCIVYEDEWQVGTV